MRPGDVVADRFEVLRAAGSGGMGVVYQARDRQGGGLVAIKALRDRSDEMAARFAQEVDILSRIEHPHVVGYVTHGATAQGTPFLVMPWLEGRDLQNVLRDGPLSVDAAMTIARAVASALAYLHGRGLVHRDLKPSNLFLPDGRVDRVQLIDLGIARATVPARPLTFSGTLLGTPGFMAPEQARGDPELSPAVDVFALGCVLFECLTGRRLFDGAHVMAVLAKILLEEAPRLRELRPEVPDALDSLVQRMVSKDPARRPRDGAELARWLDDPRSAPPCDQPPSSLAIGAREQRVVSVLVVVLPDEASPVVYGPDGTLLEAASFGSLSRRLGVRVHALDARTAIVLAPPAVGPADQAAVLARFGRQVIEDFPGASVALTTGSVLAAERLPIGAAIDRGVAIVRARAQGQGVRTDDATAALLASRFDVSTEDRWLVIGDERLSLDPTRPLLGRPTPCVGRERELAILDATLAACIDGAGPKAVIVTAPAGTGKSRVRHEWLRRLTEREDAPAVLQCRGDPMHTATPYGQVAQVIRRAAGVLEREPRAVVHAKLDVHVRRVLPETEAPRVARFLAELLGEPLADDGDLALRAARGSAEAMHDQIRLAFEVVARGWCRRGPVVLALEDVHWADDASLDLVDAVLRKLAGEPLVVVALARPEIQERFPDLWGKRDLTVIRLPPLPDRAAARLVRDVMGDRATPDDVRRIVARSEGNAFFLEELIREAATRGLRTAVQPPPARRSELPASIVAMAQARLAELDSRARQVLRAASIFGEVFWAEGLAALVGEEPSALAPVLDELVKHEVIAPPEQPRLAGARELAFRHAMLRGAAYATLTDNDRALGHRLAAHWLDFVGEDLEVVALHALDGGDRAHAAACFTRAAEDRLARAQSVGAARCATRALLVDDQGQGGIESAAIRLRLLTEALGSCRCIDSREVMAGLERHVPTANGPSKPQTARTVVHAAMDRVLEPLRAASDARGVAVVLADAACSLGALSDFAGAKRLLSEAMAIPTEEALLPRIRYCAARIATWAGEYRVVAELLSDMVLPEGSRERVNVLGILATSVVMRDGRKALPYALELVSRAEALVGADLSSAGASPTDPLASLQCLKARFFCFLYGREPVNAMQAAQSALSLARRVSLRFEECAHLHNEGEAYLMLGQVDDARRCLEQSSLIALDIGAGFVQLHDEVLLAYVASHADRIEEVVAASHTERNGWLELYGCYWLGRLLADQGAPEARRALERAIHLARELGVRMMEEDCAEALSSLQSN